MEKTLFQKIADKEIPAAIVYEDELCVAFRDIAPAAPVHVLLVPRKPIPSIAAATAEGETVILNAAKEPEIVDQANFLNKMGARIKGAGTDTITIDGVEKLDGCTHEIIPDRIEAGTFLIIAAAMGKRVVVDNIIPQHLDALISKLEEMGVDMELAGDSIIVRGAKNGLKAVDVKTQVYPGYATDLQQPLTPLLTQAVGTSHVKETIYQTRFKQCEQLNNMGANCKVEAPHAYIEGPTPLQGCDVYATDLRCGAAMVIAGLIANGVTTIHNVHYIDRGYDAIERKLIALGARIWREMEED